MKGLNCYFNSSRLLLSPEMHSELFYFILLSFIFISLRLITLQKYFKIGRSLPLGKLAKCHRERFLKAKLCAKLCATY